MACPEDALHAPRHSSTLLSSTPTATCARFFCSCSHKGEVAEKKLMAKWQLECCCSTTLITMVHGQDKYTGTLDWNSNSRNCHAIILAHLVVSSDQLQQGSMLIVGALFGGGGHMCIQHHHTTLLTIIHIPIRV